MAHRDRLAHFPHCGAEVKGAEVKGAEVKGAATNKFDAGA